MNILNNWRSKNQMKQVEDLISNDKPKIKINGRTCHHRVDILYGLTEFFNLKKYLEIGVHNGSSMSYVLQSNKNETCIGIDPFETLKTEDKEMIHYQNIDKVTEEKTQNNLNNNNKYNSNIKLIKKLSKDVLDEEISEINLLFIDGDHRYKAALNDYYKYSKYVKSGGFIVFDDLHMDGVKECFDKIVNTDKNVKLFGIYKKTEGILMKL